jgi:hypothetical protein
VGDGARVGGAEGVKSVREGEGLLAEGGLGFCEEERG